jgi:hypothetical protein
LAQEHKSVLNGIAEEMLFHLNMRKLPDSMTYNTEKDNKMGDEDY